MTDTEKELIATTKKAFIALNKNLEAQMLLLITINKTVDLSVVKNAISADPNMKIILAEIEAKNNIIINPKDKFWKQ